MRTLLAAGLLALTGCASASPDPTTEPSRPVADPPATKLWNPRQADALPAAPTRVAPALPVRVVVPDAAPDLAQRPLRAAVLAVRGDDGVHLLGVDGDWRTVPPPARGRGAELSGDGTRLAVHQEQGVDVWDLATGGRTWVPTPEEQRGWDYSSWRWVDDETMLFDDRGGGWLVDAATGDARRVPYPTGTRMWWTVDPDGAVVESADWSASRGLTDWAGGRPREVDLSATGRLASLVADRSRVAGTSYDTGAFAVYVADRGDLSPMGVLPVRDHDGYYSNGGLSVLALLDDGTVLLRVAVFGPGTDRWRVVAWEPKSGGLSLVSEARHRLPLLSVAEGVL